MNRPLRFDDGKVRPWTDAEIKTLHRVEKAVTVVFCIVCAGCVVLGIWWLA